MRRDIRVTVFSKERYYGDWPPEEASAFLSWFQEKLETIPAEYRDTARIEIDSESGYEGSHDPQIDIFYTRPETDEEIAARQMRERREVEASEQRERQLLATLKQKYER